MASHVTLKLLKRLGHPELLGKIFEIADGGFVDWTQQILQNKKERFLIGGIGFEFMFRIMHDML